ESLPGLCAAGRLSCAVWWALGTYGPLFPFAPRNVPGFAPFRFPSKFLVLVLFALSMLAGLGWQQILDICSLKEGAQRFRRVIVILSSVVVAVFVCGYSFALSNSRFFQILTGGLFPVSKDAYRVELSDSLLAIILLTGSLGVVLALAILRARWLRCLGPALTFANL